MSSILKTYNLAYRDLVQTCCSLFMQRHSFLILFIICVFQPINALERINELEWNSRIILIHALGESEEVLKTLRKLDYEIHDRDIYWFVFIEENIETNYKGDIQENFHRDILKTYFSDTETNVVLIGKDGDIKQKLKHLNLQGIFDLIDTMPMRQMEMRESN
jgi:hypothetical protein